MGITNMGFSRYPASSSSLRESVDSNQKLTLNPAGDTIYLKFRTLFDDQINVWFETSLSGYEKAGMNPIAEEFKDSTGNPILGIMLRYEGVDYEGVQRRKITDIDACDFVGYQWSVPIFNNADIRRVLSGGGSTVLPYASRTHDVFFFHCLVAVRYNEVQTDGDGNQTTVSTKIGSGYVDLKLEYTPPKVDVVSARYLPLTFSLFGSDNDYDFSYNPDYDNIDTNVWTDAKETNLDFVSMDRTDYVLRITYKAEGWLRHTDRFGLITFNIADGRSIQMINGWGQITGNDGAGTMTLDIPVNWLRTLLQTDESDDGNIYLDFNIRFNANYNANGETTYILSGRKVLLEQYKSDNTWEKIEHEIMPNNISIRIRATEKVGSGSPSNLAYLSLVDPIINTDIVKMHNIGGNTWEGIFRAPPVAKFDYQVIGITKDTYEFNFGNGHVPARISWPSEATIVPIYDPDGAVSIIYNRNISWSFSPETETEKLLGRDRDSIWYGTGGSMTASVSGSFYEEDDIPYIVNKVKPQSEKLFLELPAKGVCVFSDPYGERKKIAVTSSSVSRSESVLGLKDVDLSVTEVV